MDVHMLSNYILFENCKSWWDQGEIISRIMQNMSCLPLWQNLSTFSYSPVIGVSQKGLRHHFPQNILQNYLGYALSSHLVYDQNYQQMPKKQQLWLSILKCCI